MRNRVFATGSLLLLCLLSAVSVFSQSVSLKGTVTDSKNGQPLIGVTVTYKEGVKIISGATTDINGQYELQAGTTGVVSFSYVGYKPFDIAASQASSGTLDEKMEEDITNLNEVVISGLATSVKRSNLANDVKTINSAQLTGVTVPTTFDAALTGKVPGANIISNSGAPGGGINIRLRGVTSIFGNSQPLYVVDGVIMNNSSIAAGLNTVTAAQQGGAASNQDNPSNRIADLNPDDIASVEVLPGASAAALYGSEAAAGVIVITTKRGVPGQTKVTVTEDIGVATSAKLLGVRQFTDSTALSQFGPTGESLFQQAAGKTYDYEKAVFGNTALQNHTYISLSGGTDKTTYYIAGTFKNDDGIVLNTGYKYYGVRANIDQKITNAIKFSYSSSYVSSSADRGLFNNDNKGVTEGIGLTAAPNFVNLYPVNGVYPNDPFGASNVLQTANLVTNNELTYRTTQSGELHATLFQNDKSYLNAIVRGGFDYYNFKTTSIFPNSLQFESNGAGTDGASIQGFNNNLDLNLGASLVYYYNVNDKVDFTTSAGYTNDQSTANGILTTATQLIGDQTNVDQSGAVSVVQARTADRVQGFFAQEEINWGDKIIASGSIRMDRSSDVGDVTKYDPYPKASLAWNLTKMSFWKIKNIDELKLRVAYGESGNFPPYGVRSTLLSPPQNTGGVAGSSVGLVEGNPDILPEIQKELETGLDISLYDGRVSFSGTYYIKTDDQLLLQAQIPLSSGFTTKWINGGALQNKGVELQLTVVPVQKTNFTWTSNIAFWLNRATITQLDVPDFDAPSGGFGVTLGTFHIQQGASATQIIGISPTNPDTVWGNGEPKFTMSFDEQFDFLKNFSLTVDGYWKYDFQDINLSQLLFDLDGTSPDFDAHTLDPSGQLPNGLFRVSELGVTSAPFIQDAGYFRITQIGLYYRVPLKEGGKVVKGLRFGVSLNNYFTFTKYSSYNPDVNNFGVNGIASGVEVTPYPASREIYGHVSIDF
jgi:TonB-dependent starch-binding outer membrane protein SusC